MISVEKKTKFELNRFFRSSILFHDGTEKHEDLIKVVVILQYQFIGSEDISITQWVRKFKKKPRNI